MKNIFKASYIFCLNIRTSKQKESTNHVTRGVFPNQSRHDKGYHGNGVNNMASTSRQNVASGGIFDLPRVAYSESTRQLLKGERWNQVLSSESAVTSKLNGKSVKFVLEDRLAWQFFKFRILNVKYEAVFRFWCRCFLK